MPIQLQYETDPKGVVMAMTGVVTGKEIISVNEEAAACLECVYQIVDCTAAERLEVSMDEIHKLAIQDGSIPENSRLTKIAVVGSEEILNNIDKIYHIFSKWTGKRKSFDSQTFQSMEEARKWIGC